MSAAQDECENPNRKTARDGLHGAGFSLVELVMVAGTIALLLGSASAIVAGGAGKSQRVASDRLAGLVEQARNRAATSRTTVMLAIAEPGGAPEHPDQCALGLLEVAGDWDSMDSGPVEASLLGRWKPLETGMVFLGGNHGGLVNPLDLPKRSVRYATNRTVEAEVTGIVFNARGRMVHPSGAASAVLRIAEGGYPGGVATPKKRGADERISDTWLRIGRTTGRTYEDRP